MLSFHQSRTKLQMWKKFTFLVAVCQLFTSANCCMSSASHSEVAKCTYSKVEGNYGCHNSFNCRWFDNGVRHTYKGMNEKTSLVFRNNYTYLEFDGEFCPEVSLIQIKCNGLITVDILNLPLSVTDVDFAGNSLTNIYNLQRLLELHNLKYLDLRSNRFRSFNLKYAVTDTVEWLDLSGNLITEIYIKTLIYRMFKGNVMAIDYRTNPINCRCQNFAKSLNTYDFKIKSCVYTECFICNWIKTNFFPSNFVQNELNLIVKYRAKCIPESPPK